MILAVLVQTMAQAQSYTDGFANGWTFWSDRNLEKVTVSLPHDAMQTETRSDTVGRGHSSGFFPGGFYHYEKTINVTKELLKKHITIQFEGVYRKAKVYINNNVAGGAAYGYTQFAVCADGLLHEGQNTIRVDVDNSQVENSRWYSGAGIYRPMHLKIQEQAHIEDVKITTLSATTIQIETRHHGGDVEVNVYDGQVLVASAKGDKTILTIPNAKLWSAEHPNLYQVKVSLNGIETQTFDYGIRQISWSTKGFFVNGENVLLRGGCLHHDNGVLGACEYDEAAERKIRILKDYGFNAIRSAHNPCSEAILKACDKLGMYVMDELWDVWYDHKNPCDYASDFKDNYISDIAAFVAKDYNHPSVVMYSIANEPTEPAHEEGIAMAKDITHRLHTLDPSRPVTAGINLMIVHMNTQGKSPASEASSKWKELQTKKMTSEEYNALIAAMGTGQTKVVMQPEVDASTVPVFQVLDIAGYNYGHARYEADGTEHPERIVVGAETYPFDLFQNWEKVERLPYLIGDFMWTAWDYIGECGLGTWYYSDEPQTLIKHYPWLLAGAGALDILGHPTGEALRAKAVWKNDGQPYIGVRPISDKPLIKGSWRGTNSIPNWNWWGCYGMPTQVEVFTSAKKACLYLNNELLGEQEVKDHVATFDVKYLPGTLRAVTTDANGQEHEATLSSAMGKLDITITPERATYAPGELMFIDIDLTCGGIIVPNRDHQLAVEVFGGELLGYGSAVPITEEHFQTGRYTTWYGRSLAVIRAGQGGAVSITVKGNGLTTTTKDIKIEN